MGADQEQKQQKLISIGMPVRNEARFIASAIESVLQQQDVRLELIISDNASDDDTETICRSFAEQYPELIHYHRHDDNIGASANFAFVLDQARGEYFMWAAGHDIWDPHYLGQCQQLLDAQPSVVLAYGTPHWIDENDAALDKFSGWYDSRGLSLPARYFTVLWGSMNPILGLMRTTALRGEEMNGMVGIDLAILAALALQGEFAHAPAASWQRREFRHEQDYQQKLKRYQGADYALSTSWFWRSFPLLRLPLRLLCDLYSSQAGFANKLMLTLILPPVFLYKYLTDRKRKR